MTDTTITTTDGRAVAPFISKPEQIEREIEAAGEIFCELYREQFCTPPDERALVRAEAWLSNPPALIRALNALDQPATPDDIAVQIMLLVAAYPNASRDLKVYSKTLAEDVGAAQPGRLALEWTCRKLRRTNKFVPAIAEVLEALTDAMNRIKRVRWQLAQMPELVAEVRRSLDAAIARHRQWEESERQIEDRRT